MERLKSSLPVRLATAYGKSQASNYASVIAFNGFMTMFPLILGALAILGFVVRDPHLQASVQKEIVSLFPSTQSTTGSTSSSTNQSVILEALQGVKHSAGLFGIVSILGLLYTGTNFFSALEFALDKVYGIDTRGFLGQRLMGIGMLLAFVVALVVSVGANTLVAFVRFVPFVGVAVGAVVMVALLLLVYWVVPNRKQRWTDVWPGAVLSGVLMEVLTLVWPVYTGFAHNFSTYGQTFSLFFLLATWLYFLSQLILLGAVLNHMRLGGEPVPEPQLPAARPADEDAQRRRVKLHTGRRPHVEG